jgi:hypothetical protein
LRAVCQRVHAAMIVPRPPSYCVKSGESASCLFQLPLQK